MADEKGSLETSLGLLNFLLPFLTPHVFVREEGVTKRVVVSHMLSDALAFLGGASLLDDVLRELLHGYRDSVEEVARPGDSAGYGRQVTDNWWLLLILLIVVLDLLDLVSVLVEQESVFRLKTVLEGRSVQDALELAEQEERVRNVSNVREVLVDVLLEEGLNIRNINVELNEVSVKLIVSVLEELVVLALELLNIILEDKKDGLDVLQVVLL
jgi:hypothetical protein